MFTQRKHTAPFAHWTNKFIHTNVPKHPTNFSSNLLKNTTKNYSILPKKITNHQINQINQIGANFSSLNNLNNLNNPNNPNNPNDSNKKTNHNSKKNKYSEEDDKENTSSYSVHEKEDAAILSAYIGGVLYYLTYDEYNVRSLLENPMSTLFVSSICGICNAGFALFTVIFLPTQLLFMIPTSMVLAIGTNIIKLICTND